MREDEGIAVTFVRGGDDVSQFDMEYQDSLREVISKISDQGIEVLAPRCYTRAAYGDGEFTGDIILLKQTIAPAVIAALTAWLTSRNGRKLRIKVGDIEAEANSMKDIEDLLKRADDIKRVSESIHKQEL